MLNDRFHSFITYGAQLGFISRGVKTVELKLHHDEGVFFDQITQFARGNLIVIFF